MRLHWADIAESVPDRVGTVYAKHCANSAKLGITKKPDGTVLAHCFHCGAGGGWKPHNRDIGFIKQRLSGLDDIARSKVVALPKDYTRDVSKWEPLAYAWVSKYGITPLEVERYGLGYSACYRSIVLPGYDLGILLGVQYRRVVRSPDEPKYISLSNRRSFYNFCACVERNSANEHTVFIVEDTLSAIKCARVADSIAILGSSISDAVVARIKDYETFILYLDNDNPQVLRNRTKIAARLRNFGKVVVVHDIQDPKERSTEELNKLILCRG